MILSDSIFEVKRRIDAACKRSGRRSDQVTLVAVSKTLPVDYIKQAYQAGLRIFGESRPQEVRDKTAVLPQDIEWHFIGPLQTNKIKYVLPVCTLIHSVDSMHLAKAISDFCQKKDISANILLEVNTSDESSKIGVQPKEAVEIFKKIRLFPNINIVGLMTIAPFTNVEADIRQSFRLLAKLKEELHSEIGRNQQFELSMGMSQDYEIAIEEGSTMIRVGTSIFGSRGR
jgi:pyridoxal phosphate enzyme (YggS family)